ncbi:MAG: hypothetical protein J6N21_12825, partial [Butyrivibrio sp.]|nr:hypothetical protein [Butyrivibrio sp.]
MNASNAMKKISYKNKIISRVGKFNKKHKALAFLGMGYAVLAICIYNFLFYFYSNVKRFTCLACILLFFVSSSSFSHPTMSLNISFASNIIEENISADDVTTLSETVIAQSDAELAVSKNVDSAIIEEALQSENPDVAEAEHLNPDKQASLTDILETVPDEEISMEDDS